MPMYHDLFTLTDRIVIVTGGTGHLGREICKGLASFGARVIAIGRNKERFEELLSANTPTWAGSIECVACDVTDEASFAAAAETIWHKYGRLDGLVNNANSAKRELWDELDKRRWQEGMDATLTHYFTSTKIISDYMLRAGKGTIVNNASLFGFVAPNFNMYPEGIRGPAAHHAAAKAGVLQLTRYLATLWAARGIRVNAVTPGWFPQKRGPERPDFMREVTSRIPMGRIGQPADLVGAVIFLLSDASSYITGQNLVADGGYSIW